MGGLAVFWWLKVVEETIPMKFNSWLHCHSGSTFAHSSASSLCSAATYEDQLSKRYYFLKKAGILVIYNNACIYMYFSLNSIDTYVESCCLDILDFVDFLWLYLVLVKAQPNTKSTMYWGGYYLSW